MHVLFAQSTGTRLGEGLDARGAIGDVPMQRTLVALRKLAAEVGAYTSEVSVIATSAARRASNAGDFAATVELTVGFPLHILSGKEEAEFSFLGATAGLPPARYGVVDVGGGSTEYAVGTSGHIESERSIEIGAVRLTEAVPALNGVLGPVSQRDRASARAIAHDRFQPLRGAPPAERLMLVGGSATTMISLREESREPFLRSDVRAEEIDAMFERVCGLPLEQRRRLPGINPQRADILPGGLALLLVACALLDHGAATVSTSDLLAGYLLAYGSP